MHTESTQLHEVGRLSLYSLQTIYDRLIVTHSDGSSLMQLRGGQREAQVVIGEV